ncbi:MAG: B12-binding domain-containing radical SAM protein [Phycisphaerae bacterium]
MKQARSDKLTPAVVLVADRTLSAGYKVLFEGILATMQTTAVPGFIMRRLLSPPAPTDADGRALLAPLGLRRVESALLEGGELTGDDVAVTTPERLHELLGPWTRVLAISSSDFLGGGMSNTTTSSFWSGELYTRRWTRRMLQGVRDAKRRWGFSILAGGAGAWQLVQNPDEASRLGIDVVFQGYFESAGPRVVRELLQGRNIHFHVRERRTCASKVTPIHGASCMGVVELSRGCGNGCGYCTMGSTRMEHLPPELIAQDVRTNCRAGQTTAVSSSEDFFRYGSSDGEVNPDALCRLLEQLRREPVRFMQIDHANVSSVLQFSDRQLWRVRKLLSSSPPTDYLWVNLGAESANGELVSANGPGKLGDVQPGEWSQAVLETAEKLSRTGFFPVFSLVLGLPGETPGDVRDTLRLVRRLSAGAAVIFPVFHEPVREGETSFTLEEMTLEHLELYRTCYELNFRWVPRLFSDNQRVGGAGRLRRTLFQMLGRGEVFSWRRNFARLGRRLRNASDGPKYSAAVTDGG